MSFSEIIGEFITDILNLKNNLIKDIFDSLGG